MSNEENIDVVKWRTMESAPKDGFPVDLWMEGLRASYRLPDCYWSKMHGVIIKFRRMDQPAEGRTVLVDAGWVDEDGTKLSEDKYGVPVMWIRLPPLEGYRDD